MAEELGTCDIGTGFHSGNHQKYFCQNWRPVTIERCHCNHRRQAHIAGVCGACECKDWRPVSGSEESTPLRYDIVERRGELANLLKTMFGFDGEWTIKLGPTFANTDLTPQVGDKVTVTLELERSGSKESTEEKRVPDATMQQLLDAGLNAFGLQLFIESIADVYGKSREIGHAQFEPITISFRGVLVKFSPDPDRPLDGRHH